MCVEKESFVGSLFDQWCECGGLSVGGAFIMHGCENVDVLCTLYLEWMGFLGKLR